MIQPNWCQWDMESRSCRSWWLLWMTLYLWTPSSKNTWQLSHATSISKAVTLLHSTKFKFSCWTSSLAIFKRLIRLWVWLILPPFHSSCLVCFGSGFVARKTDRYTEYPCYGVTLNITFLFRFQDKWTMFLHLIVYKFLRSKQVWFLTRNHYIFFLSYLLVLSCCCWNQPRIFPSPKPNLLTLALSTSPNNHCCYCNSTLHIRILISFIYDTPVCF